MKSHKRIGAMTLDYVLLVLFSLMVIMPFSIILCTSFKTKLDAMTVPFTMIGKHGFSLQGYRSFFDYGLLLSGFMNTMITSLAPTFVCLLVSAMAAFAYAKINFPFRNAFFAILIFTMMIPGTILLVTHWKRGNSTGYPGRGLFSE